jgi:hypothetical protein
MSPARSLGKAFRPSRAVLDSEPAERADTSLERATRIRAYAMRVRMKLPLFEGGPSVGLGTHAWPAGEGLRG